MKRFVLVGLVSGMASMGCTAAQQQDWASALSALGKAAPSACVVVTAVDGSSVGQVCAADAAAAAALAGAVSGIIANLPSTAAVPVVKVAAPALVRWDTGGFHLEIQSAYAAPVQAAIAATGKKS
jgi:hypothetical protein